MTIVYFVLSSIKKISNRRWSFQLKIANILAMVLFILSQKLAYRAKFIKLVERKKQNIFFFIESRFKYFINKVEQLDDFLERWVWNKENKKQLNCFA